MARPRLDRPNFRLTLRGGRYYVAWWADGAAQRLSCGTDDEQKAREFLAQFAAGFGTPEPPAVPTVGKILDGYLADRKADGVKAYGTLEAAAKAVRRHLGDLQPDHLTKERARFYATQRRAEGYEVGPPTARRRKPVSDGTIIRELPMLRAALRWAVGEKWIAAAPVVPVPKMPPPRDRWLTRQEAGRLFAGCEAFHVKLFAMMALFTAARRRAILDLPTTAVSFPAPDLAMVDLGPAVGRKGRAVVPITEPSVVAMLRDAIKGSVSGRLIETPGGEPVADVKTGFRAAARRAVLVGVTPHVLRHTAATWMAQAGVPMRDIALFLGHRDTKTTERTYAKHHPDYLRAAAAGLGALPLAPETGLGNETMARRGKAR